MFIYHCGWWMWENEPNAGSAVIPHSRFEDGSCKIKKMCTYTVYTYTCTIFFYHCFKRFVITTTIGIEHFSHSIHFLCIHFHKNTPTFRMLFWLLIEDFLFFMNVIESMLLEILDIAELGRSYLGWRKELKGVEPAFASWWTGLPTPQRYPRFKICTM